jgi:hypothetical protein
LEINITMFLPSISFKSVKLSVLKLPLGIDVTKHGSRAELGERREGVGKVYSNGTTADVYSPTTGDTQDAMVVCALSPAEVRSQRTLALSPSGIGSIGFMILLPFTLHGTGLTFSRGFFKAYVVVAFI